MWRNFLMVDNGSEDGSAEYLETQRDVSLWTTQGSYKASSFGVDWLNHLQWRYGADHWCLVADVDEFLLYPYADTRPLHALTDWLDSQGRKSFSAMLLDMYPKGPIAAQPYRAGQNPFEIARWFDAANYSLRKKPADGQSVDTGRRAPAPVHVRQPRTGPGAEQGAAGALVAQICLCQFQPYGIAARAEPGL